jgi:hypothetical protein
MKACLSSILFHHIARILLLIFAVIAVGPFLSACAGPAYRHDRRVDRRTDRRDYRYDRRYDRWDRRYERWE